ncbi:hypothetical protein DHB64_17855 [Antarcticibacterium sp. W02-3]|nr:hypothetical protein [Antarcticibacterium sp. W02-3]
MIPLFPTDFRKDSIAPFQGMIWIWFFFEGLHPSLMYCALSGLDMDLILFRGASPLADGWRPFRAWICMGFEDRGAAPLAD